jgi:hypothetical protein
MPDTPRSETYDDEQLMRYLIGSLDEQETERFDELSIADDEFADRLRIVEDDLVDAYARGELSSEMRARFEAHYLMLPGKQDRIRFAEALVLSQRRETPADSIGPRSASSGRPAIRAFVWPLVAASSLAIVVVGYVLLQRSSQPGASTQRPASSVSTEPSSPELRGRASGSTPAAPRPAPVAIVLMPSTRRVAEPATLSIPRGVPTVEVSLVLDADDFPTYSVALKDAGSDRVLWKGTGLKASSSGADRIVLVSLDPELLKPQHYTLDLSGVRASGRPEVITSYPFRVVVH